MAGDDPVVITGDFNARLSEKGPRHFLDSGFKLAASRLKLNHERWQGHLSSVCKAFFCFFYFFFWGGHGPPLHVLARVRILVWPLGFGPFSHAPPQSSGPRFHSPLLSMRLNIWPALSRVCASMAPYAISIATRLYMWINYIT